MPQLQHRQIQVNDLSLHIAEQGPEQDLGKGMAPLVILIHGFPESWYSWRHQIPVLAEAGYKVVALDMPGYGDSDVPADILRYNQVALSDDIAALASALGYEEFIVVGHDWGAPTAWMTALRFPERVNAVVGMSVPYGGRPPQPPTVGFRQLFKDCFFYMLYFQQPGVAEAELEADISVFLRSFLFSCCGENPKGFNTTQFSADATLLQVMKDPKCLPKWLSEEEFHYYRQSFEKTGLRGSLNYYRNLDHTWALTEGLKDRKIEQPALFLAGDSDPVPHFGRELERMSTIVPRVASVTIDDCGHWTQQEQPQAVNRELLAFLKSL